MLQLVKRRGRYCWAEMRYFLKLEKSEIKKKMEKIKMIHEKGLNCQKKKYIPTSN